MYWDGYWQWSEFRTHPNGALEIFDPIEVLDKPKWREYLEKHGVEYKPMNLELNPNKRGKAKKFDVLVPVPRDNATAPWHPSLNKYLELEYEFPEVNPKARIFKVNI